ncbi:large neutral amino acids transporter small subunit 1-like [Mercenaria mercenaria]|uniref:large neutral amino acids transporter small subunit 1-like n=1 Tax=Mercenaria mercenaria TaxID=6596 RepID=UPI00234EBCE5|nr:large neutral amino acids transporter small subunit 1-like [Mercenaria mercenaria]
METENKNPALTDSNGEMMRNGRNELNEKGDIVGTSRQSNINGFTTIMNEQTNTGSKTLKIETVVSLKKQISLVQSVAIIVGIIIGSGIFVSPVGILTNVKSVGMSCVMWTVCGVFSGLCALCYAELGACIPQSGGEYIYIKRAFGDFPGFLCLWINFIIICPVGIAASSLIFATYVLKPVFPDCEPPATALRLLAALVVTLLVSINCINVKWSTKFQVVITTSKLGALMMIIVIGFIYIGKGEIDNFNDSFADSDFSAGSIAIAFYSGFWAFGGWSYLNFLTDELIEPHKNLPRAIVISITIVTVVYLIANIAYFAVLTPSEMLASSAVAVTFSQLTIPAASWITPILIAISVMGSINGNSLSMSRLFMTGAEYKHLPSFISMINIKYLTPAPSLLVIMVLTVIMQSFEEIFYLIELMGFGFSMVLCCVFAGQIYLRYKEPDLHRPIKLPIGLPIFLLLVSVVILVLTVYQKPSESGLGLLLIAFGAPLYFVFICWGNKPKPVQNLILRCTYLIQKVMYACPSEGDKRAF